MQPTPSPQPSLTVNKRVPSSKKLNPSKSLSPRETLSFERKTKIRKHFFQDKFSIDRQHFYVSKSLKGVKKINYKKAMGEIVKEFGDFIYFKVPEMTMEQSLNRSHGYPVLLNKSNGTLSVLSGTLLIRSGSLQDLENLKEKHGFEIVRSIPALKTHFVKLRREDNVFRLTKELKNNPNVFNVTPEVLGSILTPQ
jgi:hypothetical protein